MAIDFGTFTYTSDKSIKYKIRMSVATAGLQDPASPTDAQTVDESVQVGSNRRSLGLHARGLRLSRPVGTAPNIFARTTFMPICTQAQYATIQIGTTFTVNGVEYKVSKKVPEVAN
jgi:hypothetical protein